MSTIRLFDATTGDQEGFMWPLESATGGQVPSVSSWRQWGHSWAAGGHDDSIEAARGRMTERIAGVMHLPPHAVHNEAVAGSGILDATVNGFERVLRKCVPRTGHQNWPWEPGRFGVEAIMWGLNDIGAHVDTGTLWSGQAAMWNTVWANSVRSVISRLIAGGIFYAFPGSSGLSAPVWHTTSTPPYYNPNPPVMAGDFNFVPKGPGGVGIGQWVYKLATGSNSSDGYWYTTQNGDQMVITVPADYDTGTIAIRHLCPGSWFDGPAQARDSLGGAPPASGTLPVTNVLTGAEHVRSPSAVTVTGPGLSATVDCRGLANRAPVGAPTSNPGAGIIGTQGAMTHVSRHALTPTPGNTQTITLTVGGLPAGGWYGFDSWEIQAKQYSRPIVIVANVANPANWFPLYFLAPQTVWNAANTRAQAFSSALTSVVAEFADPGIMVADIRTKIAPYPTEYCELVDGQVDSTHLEGNPVELSSFSTFTASGDGTHPHALGQRLIVEAHLEALANADLPVGRGAIPFAPGRSLAYARSSGE